MLIEERGCQGTSWKAETALAMARQQRATVLRTEQLARVWSRHVTPVSDTCKGGAAFQSNGDGMLICTMAALMRAEAAASKGFLRSKNRSSRLREAVHIRRSAMSRFCFLHGAFALFDASVETLVTQHVRLISLRFERSRRRSVTLHANPLILAAAIGIASAAFLVVADRQTVDTLYVHHIKKSEAPVIDGDASDSVWLSAQPFFVLTNQGGNFEGRGETKVEIRAVYDDGQIYFLFAWDDPTRSLKQLPLRKAADGWHILHDGYETGDEHAYSEDRFSVLLTKLDFILAGDRTFHAGSTPIAGEPATLSGRGLHYTTQEGVYAEVLEWKATSTATGFCDDDHFGPPVDATADQVSGKAPYHGGFAPNPGTANYSDNFEPQPADGYDQPIKPRRLPKDYRAMAAAMGNIDIDPNHGENAGARWYMTEAESTPYDPGIDAGIPVGTVIPGVVIAGEYTGDRANVQCASRWAAGRWVLKVARRLDTKSSYGIPISTGTFIRVAAFDHSQIRHTRHVRPIRLQLE